MNLAYHDVLCTINCIPQVPKLSKRHDEHPNKAFNRSPQWILFVQLITIALIALEYDVVGLGEAHDEHGVDDAEAHQVLGEHPVDHDHHGANELEPATEEKEVESITEHDQLSHWVFQVVEAGKADWHTKLEKNAGEKEADSGRAECHVLHEDLPTKEGKLSDCLEDVEESHQN